MPDTPGTPAPPGSPKPKPKNPLVHSHDDDHHHHHHGSDSIDVLDPAQQSLSDALRVSFVILKTIMLLLLVVYCFTGVFRVDAREVAVRLQFGKIVGEEGSQVYRTGRWHFGWPRPIEQVIYVPIVQRDIIIADTFWFKLDPKDTGKRLDELPPPRGGLNPEQDGSLLTGDANIIHAQFTVKYKIIDAVDYVKHVGDVKQAGDISLADKLVRTLAEEGIVRTVAQANADDIIKGQFEDVVAKKTIQKALNELKAGIEITQVLMPRSTMPLSVRAAYDEVINAESERVQKIDDARRDRTTTLNAAAGEAHEALFKLIIAYDLAYTRGDEQEVSRIGDQLDAAFDSFEVDFLPIGGDAARILSAAKSYRTQVVEQVKSEANSFNSLLELYRKNPALVRSRLWQRAREEIFTGDVETFYADGQIYLTTNRDPDIRRKKEQQQLLDAKKNPGALGEEE